MHHKSTKVGFEAYQPVLDQMRALMPPGMVIALLADRGGCRMNNCFPICANSSGTFACG